MRKFIAILAAEFARFITQVTKRGSGSALPGVVAQKVDPNIIYKLAHMLPKGIIIVTGTNGKTTTAKMIAGILQESGTKVIYNFSGSNLSRGIASFLIQHTNFWGTKIDGEIGLFEVDEATMPEIVSMIQPNIIVVTNLFRDQLDRYGEVDKTASIIDKAIKMSPNSLILLNGDDPLVASLGADNKNAAYFGIDTDYKTKSTGAIDSRNCISCGHELVFNPRYFGHLGNYNCPNCSFARPKINFSLRELKLHVEGSEAALYVGKDKVDIKITLPGLYNLYNALTAASVAKLIDVPGSVITHSLENITAAFGRMEKIKVDNKNIYLMLVKNPTGFTQTVETLTYDDKPKSVLLALNDNFADGTDISWIWDTEMEIATQNISSAIASGIRAEDMQLRLKYAGYDMKKVLLEKDLKTALDKGLAQLKADETLYILPTYTAMLEIRRILASRGLVKGFLE
jgi:lipid II isoglutaminyl synthase (glutamine-hydrolysing)